jgi:hypothetical protein
VSDEQSGTGEPVGRMPAPGDSEQRHPSVIRQVVAEIVGGPWDGHRLLCAETLTTICLAEPPTSPLCVRMRQCAVIRTAYGFRIPWNGTELP